LEINILGTTESKYILELNASLTNKGHVRHMIENFSFELLYLLKTQPRPAKFMLASKRKLRVARQKGIKLK
jgi:hypothetical protein